MKLFRSLRSIPEFADLSLTERRAVLRACRKQALRFGIAWPGLLLCCLSAASGPLLARWWAPDNRVASGAIVFVCLATGIALFRRSMLRRIRPLLRAYMRSERYCAVSNPSDENSCAVHQ